jgi:hypothetical protein
MDRAQRVMRAAFALPGFADALYGLHDGRLQTQSPWNTGSIAGV